MNYHIRCIGILIITTLFLSSCSSFIASTASGPTQEDYSTRTLGTVVEDNTIKSKAKALLQQHETLRTANIEVHSFNRVILLTGQVPDAASKALASETVANIRHLKSLHNELEIAQNNSFSNNMHDSYLKTKVVTRFIATQGIDSDSVEKIVTNGKLYLMGLVTPQEAAAIVNAAKQVTGLKQIVKVFEYVEKTPE